MSNHDRGYSSNEPFKNAHKAFLATLSAKDRASFPACSSPDDLIKTLQELECLSKEGQKRQLNRYLGVLKKLSDRLQPYFDALNVIASAEINAAIAYGAFRVVLQLASSFPTFLEKLIAVLGCLADKFPQYNAIVKVFEGNPPCRMRRHLENVYQDLFQFLQTAARIFTASSGKVKRPVGMIATVVWNPFDARFNGLLNQMDKHRMFIMDELEIYQAQQAKDAERAAALERAQAEKEREKANEDRKRVCKQASETEEMKETLDKEARDSSIQRILNWLAPPLFVEALEKSQEQREEGTAQWIFDNTAFQEWKASSAKVEEDVKWDKMPPWVLWVHGNPGCGKTVLASSVVEEIVEGDSQDQLNKTCYFFFKYDDPRSSTVEAVYRSALAQILHRNRVENDMLDKFLFARYDPASFSGQQMATPKELLDLMRVCASELGQLSLILDGIDESDQPDLTSHRLKELVTTAPVKLICFSRPNVNSLQNLVEHHQRVGIDRNAMSSDIRLFLIHQLHALLKECKLPSTANIEDLADTLVHGADGMFLWAKLMVKYLKSLALTPSSRLRTINSVRFPEGLDAMYDRIVTLISKSDTPQIDLARRIMLWLNHSISLGDGLTYEVLQSAVGDDNDQDVFEDFTSVVISVCGGLVEFTPQKMFQFTHLTVKEYFKGQPWSRVGLTAPLVPGEALAAVEITLRCLRYLLNHKPTQVPAKLSRPWDPGMVCAYRASFEAYVMKYWGKHLSHTKFDQLCPVNQQSAETQNTVYLLDLISRFLETPLAIGFWIEGLYKSQQFITYVLDDIQDWSHQVVSFAPTGRGSMKLQLVAKCLVDLSLEIRSLDKEWSSKLLVTPSLIWDDVLAFHKGRFLSRLAEASGTPIITTMTPDGPKGEDGKSIQCLCTVSSNASDGITEGVLSIYPSPAFERSWKTMNAATAYQEAERFSSGWTAKYELWSLDSKTRLASLDISLPESEIRLLLRQSFRQDLSKRRNPFNSQQICCGERDDESFETSFPMAISHDCLTFAILRTVHNIRLRELASITAYRSFVLPLDFLEHFHAKWTPQLNVFDPDNFSFLPEIFRISWRDWYTYSISFSPDGKYLSFADYQTPCMTHLAVFEVFQEPRFSARLVRWTMVRFGPPRVKEMVFHPQQPLLAFLSEMKVWIWDFHKGDSKPVHLPTQFNKCHQDIKTREKMFTCDTRFLLDQAAEIVTFSLCGKYLLARNKKDVEVLLVPQEMLAPEAHRHVNHASAPRSMQEPIPATSSNNMVGLEDTRLRPGGIMSGTHLAFIGQNNKSMKALVVTTVDNDLKMESVAHASLANKNYLQLLSLPDSFNTRNTAVSLRIPMSSDDSLRVMFNKKAAEGYSLSDGKQGQFPTIIERKLTSIVQVGPVSCPSQLSGHYPDIPPPKRLKRDDIPSTLF